MFVPWAADDHQSIMKTSSLYQSPHVASGVNAGQLVETMQSCMKLTGYSRNPSPDSKDPGTWEP